MLARLPRWRARATAPGVALVGFALSSAVIWQASQSASSAQAGDGWAAGRVALSAQHLGRAMFDGTGLSPGAGGRRCIVITALGSRGSTVRMYATGATGTKGLSSSIDLTVTAGSGGGGSCAGFTPLASGAIVYAGTLANFAATARDFTTGTGSWRPGRSAPNTRTFQFAYRLDPATPDSAQGGTALIGFTWQGGTA